MDVLKQVHNSWYFHYIVMAAILVLALLHCSQSNQLTIECLVKGLSEGPAANGLYASALVASPK